MTTRMETGVREMCNLSEGLYERAAAFAQRRVQELTQQLVEEKAQVLAEEKAQVLAEEKAQVLAEEKANMKVAETTRKMNRNVACQLHGKGMNESDIADVLSISVDEVRELLSEPQPA